MSDPANYDNVYAESNFDGNDGDVTYTPSIRPIYNGNPVNISFTNGAHIEDDVPLFGNAVVELDGVDDALLWGNALTFQFLCNHSISYALEIWVYFDSQAGDQIYLSNTYAPSSGNESGFNMGADASGNMIGGVSASNGMLESFAAPGVFTADTWHYVKLSFDVNTGAKVRVDGSIVVDVPIGAAPGTQYILGLCFGRYRYNAEAYVDGRIGPFRLTRFETLDDDTVPTDIFARPEAPDYFGWMDIPGPLNPAVVYFSAEVDYSRVSTTQSIRFGMEITGSPPIQIPISVWQATLSTDSASFTQCHIPNVTDYVDEINARRIAGERFIIFRLFELGEDTASIIGKDTAQIVVLDAPMESVSFSESNEGYSCSISGYDDPYADPAVQHSYLLTGIRSINQNSSGTLRARCSPNWQIKPGDIVDTEFQQFTATYITYYANATDVYMVVGQR